jgi:hypothetical protein
MGTAVVLNEENSGHPIWMSFIRALLVVYREQYWFPSDLSA